MFNFIKQVKWQVVVFVIFLTILLLGPLRPAYADSYWYSDTISTYAVTDATRLAPDIDYASCKIQSIRIVHVTASSETYKIYKLADSTTTVTWVGTIYLPATIGTYDVLSDNILNGTEITGSDLIAVPDLYMRHDNETPDGTWCPTDTVQIIYKR